MSYEFSGQTREEISSGGQSATIFLLCLIFIYFLLAAQYESYILPLAVILSIPAGIFGVFVAIGLTGIENNIYVQVALVMLIGSARQKCHSDCRVCRAETKIGTGVS